MEVLDCKRKIRCELGACKAYATSEIKFDRVGIRGRIHLCEKCLCELYAAIGKSLVPKSVETAKKKTKGDDTLYIATSESLDGKTVKREKARAKGDDTLYVAISETPDGKTVKKEKAMEKKGSEQ